MFEAIGVAFKEWAAVCRALASHRQCVLLRKGGIAEEAGIFRVEHSEFLLYPTYFHEHLSGLKPEYRSDFATAEDHRPAAGTITFEHFVRVSDIHYASSLETALALDSFHAWNPELIRQRFFYRTPGLYVLTVRVYRLTAPITRAERPEYAGCKTWVALDSAVPTAGAEPIFGDEEFAARTQRIREVLRT
jgi:hypothetical protein